jgi:hypothetical protein
MFTIVLGVNPINMSAVDRSAANIIRAMVEFIPGGGLITRALDTYGVFEKVGAWVEGQIKSLGMTGSAIRQALMDFIHSLSWTDVFDLGGVWERAKAIFTAPVARLISFAKGLITGILNFIRDAVLKPLAQLAQNSPGYDLLKAVLGKDPITGDAAEQSADALIGGFMKLIGQEEVWANIKRGNAIARAFAWFKGALSGLLGFVRQIPGMIMGLLRSITIEDFLPITNLFGKVVKTFGGFLGSFGSWALAQVIELLKIIFDVVAPSVVPYIMKAAGAFKTIVKNPIGFVGNLVRAGLLGFKQFAGNFLNHLRKSLIEWLTGTLSGAAIYIPQSFSLKEMIKFVLSVLGLTWANVRPKLVKAMTEPVVVALEATFDIVVTLVRDGPAAAWEKLKDYLSNLRDMVLEQVISFVKERVIDAAIQKLLTSLNPAGAFIQAIIAIYNTIMFFVERLQQIARVVAAFIDSISAIASGNIGSAASRVETTMAGMLTLVISFLARIAGLGKVTDAVLKIVKKVRDPIDKAIDAVIAWIVATAKRLFAALFGKKDKKDDRTDAQKQQDLSKAVAEAQQMLADPKTSPRKVEKKLGAIKSKYKLTSLTLVIDSKGDDKELDHVHAEINPTLDGQAVEKKAKTYLGAKKTGAKSFEGSFDDAQWNWSGYPSGAVKQHPANAKYHQPNTSTTVPKPTGAYTVAGAGTEGQKYTDAWRAIIRDRVEAIKADLMKQSPGLQPDTYERNAKKQIETEYGGLDYKNLYLIGWQAHHIHPVNWGGADSDSNYQYLLSGQHSAFTTWFNGRKKAILDELNKED